MAKSPISEMVHHSPYHWSMDLDGDRLDYWPTAHRWHWRNQKHRGLPTQLNAFVRKVRKAIAKEPELSRSAIHTINGRMLADCTPRQLSDELATMRRFPNPTEAQRIRIAALTSALPQGSEPGVTALEGDHG